MAVAYLNGKAGVWRTVGGRRIFIATGQSLRDAMKASGKFKNLDDDTEENRKKRNKLVDEDDREAKIAYERAQDKWEYAQKRYDRDSESYKKAKEEYEAAKEKYTETSRTAGEHYADEYAKSNKKYIDENGTEWTREELRESWKVAKESGNTNKDFESYIKQAVKEKRIDKLNDNNIDDIVKDYVKSGKSQDDLRKALYSNDSEVSANKTVSALQDFYIQKQDQYTRMYENGEISFTALEAANRFNFDDAKFNSYKEIMAKDGISIKGKVLNAGDRVQMEDPYTHNYFGDYTIVREATRSEKLGKMNADMKGYIVNDNKGNESLVSEIRVKKKADVKPLKTLDDYKQYYKELGYSDNVAAAMAKEQIGNRVN